MAKVGEINYLRGLGEAGRRHALSRPFSDKNCWHYLVELGAIFALLPPPPLRLLDVGCGTGWTSRFFARRGYDVVGVDICPDMIDIAQQSKEREGHSNLQFQISDYESMEHEGAFDLAVFYDSLHHAVDEEAALRMVCRALKPGGVCVTSEPGRGHSESAHTQAAVARFNTTEKDMPPDKIIATARKVGFRKHQVFPHAFDLGRATYQPQGEHMRFVPAWLRPFRKLATLLMINAIYLVRARRSGIVVLTK